MIVAVMGGAAVDDVGGCFEGSVGWSSDSSARAMFSGCCFSQGRTNTLPEVYCIVRISWSMRYGYSEEGVDLNENRLLYFDERIDTTRTSTRRRVSAEVVDRTDVLEPTPYSSARTSHHQTTQPFWAGAPSHHGPGNSTLSPQTSSSRHIPSSSASPLTLPPLLAVSWPDLSPSLASPSLLLSSS